MSQRALVLCLALAVAGCPDPKKNTPDSGPGEELPLDGPALLGGLNCDPLVPSACGYPFPSNVYLVDDAALPSGKKVEFGPSTLPKYFKVAPMDRTFYEDRDGFSPGQAPMAHLPGATLAGCATQDTIALSTTDLSPTLLIEAATGTRIPHFVELDSSTTDPTDQAFMLRPVVRLKDSTRYLVAIRNVVDGAGAKLQPTPVFASLRDGTASDDRSVEPRRALYLDLFAKLQTAGVGKADLQLAWDYTTASRQNTTGWMLKMRDDALALVGTQGPEYTITSVVENPNSFIRRRIEGTMHVPLYLDKAGPGARLNLVNGAPKQNGFADYPFLVQVPNSVANAAGPAPIVQQGHGLLGDRTEGWNSYFARLAEQKKYVTIAVDMVGMAEDDEALIKEWLTGDLGQFRSSVDRQHQGMLNQLLAMRMMKGRFVNEPQVQFGGHSAIDPTQAYYRGDSQGGIMGVTYLALSTDVTRGFLGEPGMPYSLLLYRSVDFTDFFVILQNTYRSALDLQVVMGCLQMLWDRSEPDGYAPYVTPADAAGRLPGTPQHQVFIVDAIGDYQVTPLGAHLVARAVGATSLKPVARSVFGIPESDVPVTGGSGFVEFDYKLPVVPSTNVPPLGASFPSSGDPHDKVRQTQAVFDMTDKFLREGVAKNFCAGACDGTTEPNAP
jgi:hypothetical protein